MSLVAIMPRFPRSREAVAVAQSIRCLPYESRGHRIYLFCSLSRYAGRGSWGEGLLQTREKCPLTPPSGVPRGVVINATVKSAPSEPTDVSSPQMILPVVLVLQTPTEEKTVRTSSSTSKALATALAFSLTSSALADESAATIKISQADTHLDVTIGGKPFTTYWFGKREDRLYVRPFFYPVLAPGEVEVTADQYASSSRRIQKPTIRIINRSGFRTAK